MENSDSYMRMVSRIEELAEQVKKLTLDLYEWDPEGACSRSMATALLDVENAYENVTGESVETPSEIVEILKEEDK